MEQDKYETKGTTAPSSSIEQLEEAMEHLNKHVNDTCEKINDLLRNLQKKDVKKLEGKCEEFPRETPKDRLMDLKEKTGWIHQNINHINEAISTLRGIIN